MHSKHSLALAAALTGLLGGTAARLQAAPARPGAVQAGFGKSLGKAWGSFAADKGKKEKHACQGQNSCKGKGGCKSGDNGCSGKNSCKGKGGCATDGSKKEDKK